MAARTVIAAVLLALMVSSSMAQKTAQGAASVAAISAYMSTTSPNFAKVFSKTRAPQFLMDNFMKGAYRFTLFFPTDEALAKYKPQGACAKIPMSNILAQLMVPTMYSGKQLSSLKRGFTMRTMSPVYLRILGKDSKGRVKIGIVNGYQKIVSWATIVKTDALVNQRTFTMHQIDTVITNCGGPGPAQ